MALMLASVAMTMIMQVWNMTPMRMIMMLRIMRVMSKLIARCQRRRGVVFRRYWGKESRCRNCTWRPCMPPGLRWMREQMTIRPRRRTGWWAKVVPIGYMQRNRTRMEACRSRWCRCRDACSIHVRNVKMTVPVIVIVIVSRRRKSRGCIMRSMYMIQRLVVIVAVVMLSRADFRRMKYNRRIGSRGVSMPMIRVGNTEYRGVGWTVAMVCMRVRFGTM